MDREGEWSLSPSYDLIFSDGPGGEHSMTVNGEGLAPTLQDIKTLANTSGIRSSDMNNIIDEVVTAVRKWISYAEEAEVSSQTLETISRSMYIKQLIL